MKKLVLLLGMVALTLGMNAQESGKPIGEPKSVYGYKDGDKTTCIYAEFYKTSKAMVVKSEDLEGGEIAVYIDDNTLFDIRNGVIYLYGNDKDGNTLVFSMEDGFYENYVYVGGYSFKYDNGTSRD